MGSKRYRVLLDEAERTRLTALISRGAAPAQAQTHARILLKADQSPDGPAWTDASSTRCRSVNGPSSGSGAPGPRRDWRLPSRAARHGGRGHTASMGRRKPT